MMRSIIVIQFGLFFFETFSLATADIVQLDVLPNHQIYELGEDVVFTCCSADSMNSKVFEFYKEGSKLHSTELSTNCTNFEIKIKTKQDAGSFQCLYQELKNGTNIESNMSRSITINIADTPQAPSIRLTPSYTVYTKEESLTLTCSPPIGISAKGIQIYQEKKKIHEGDPLHSDYTISASLENASGKYTCKYWVEMNGRKIISSESDYVTVSVTETPQAPSIRLTPSYTVYTKEESFTLTCSPPIGISAKGIQVYQEKKKIHEGDPLHSDYTISASSENASGKYACKYWVEINGRNISSSESDYVTVSVTDTPLAPLLSLIPRHPVYIRGESIKLTCTTQFGSTANGFDFYKDKQKIASQQYGTVNISTADSAKYSCQYIKNILGRNIHSIPSDEVTIKTVEVPHAPSISLTPSHPVYVRRETINITCSAPDGLEVMGIQFFKDGQQIASPDTPKRIFSHIIFNSSQDNVGKYSCGFWVNHDGRQILSQMSLSIVINIVDAPVAPVLMLVPNYQLYVTGETLEMLCMADSSAKYNFNIHKNDQLLIKSTVPEKVYRYSILSLNHGDSGNYTATYHKNIQGRMLESFTSQPLNVHVIDPLPAPNLTLGYSVEKVNDGFQVTLNCSAPDSDLMRTFYFIKTSDKHSEQNVTDYLASLTWELGYISHVTFYCEYEEEIQERKIRSRRSQILTIPLAGPSLLSPPAVAGIIGVVSLLLCLALVLLFYMKYKRKYKEKRLNFSLYWKTPKKASKQHILNHAKSKEEVNQDQENLGEVSRKSKRLSIATAKNNSEDIAMNFYTFQTGQSKNLSDDDLSTFQSQPEQSEDLPTSALATFHCQPRPSEDLPTANCVWNYSYL